MEKVPYKGTTAIKLEQREMERIFRPRVELELLAIEWVKESVTPTDIEHPRGAKRPARRPTGAETVFLT